MIEHSTLDFTSIANGLLSPIDGTLSLADLCLLLQLRYSSRIIRESERVSPEPVRSDDILAL